MRDYRKFCRPKTIKNPLSGDYEVTLNCGNTVYVNKDEFDKKTSKYFKKYLIILDNTNSGDPDNPGNPADQGNLENVLEWIEIGGIKWATRLLGAESPGEEGDLYQWGNIESGGEYVEDNQYYQFISHSDQYGNYEGYNYSKYNSTDNKTVLEENDDPATYNLGSNWRTPTIEEFLSLVNNTTVEFSNDLFVYTDKLDPSKKLYIPLYNRLMSSTLGNYYNNGDDFITNLVLDSSYYLESNCCCALSPDTDLNQIYYSGYEYLRFCLFYVLPVYVGEGE